MKIIIFFIWLISFPVFAQFSVESNFNAVHIGRNQNLLAKYQWKKISANFGVKYNFNKLNTFPQAEMFKNSFWAINFGEHWGIETGFQIKLLCKSNFDLFGFYQLQFSKSHIRHDWFGVIGSLVPEPQSEYDLIYMRRLGFIGPILGFENNLGLGINAYFTNSLYFTTKLGGGIFIHKNLDKNNLILGANNWDFSGMISMGLGWKFSNN